MTQETTTMPSGLTRRVSAEIRAELARQQKSQRHLCVQINMHPGVFSRRLTGAGGRCFTIAEVDRIADALGVPVNNLLGVRPAVPA
jgi:hypothetical protein